MLQSGHHGIGSFTRSIKSSPFFKFENRWNDLRDEWDHWGHSSPPAKGNICGQKKGYLSATLSNSATSAKFRPCNSLILFLNSLFTVILLSGLVLTAPT